MGDGYWQVAHDNTDTEPEEAEGSDVLRNIELLQFDNGCFVLGPEPMEACGSYRHRLARLRARPRPRTSRSPLGSSSTGTNTVDNPTNVQFRWLMAEEEDVNAGEEWLAERRPGPAELRAQRATDNLVCERHLHPG